MPLYSISSNKETCLVITLIRVLHNMHWNLCTHVFSCMNYICHLRLIIMHYALLQHAYSIIILFCVCRSAISPIAQCDIHSVNKVLASSTGYTHMLTIAVGSRNINIREESGPAVLGKSFATWLVTCSVEQTRPVRAATAILHSHFPVGRRT